MNELIKYSEKEIEKLNSPVVVTNKLIKNSNGEKVLAFCKRNKRFFSYLISKNYPLDIELISHFENKLEWSLFYRNDSLLWTCELLEKFQDRLDWFKEYDSDFDNLVGNTTIFWDSEKIRKIRELNFEHGFIYPFISRKSNVNWSIDLLKEFESDWNWEDLSNNYSLPWNEELIDLYMDKWNWSYLSRNWEINWNEKLLYKYKNKVDWNSISGLKNVEWSNMIIDKFFDYWNWNKLSGNYFVNWNERLIKKYQHIIDWPSLSSNHKINSIPEYLFEEYENKWDWEKLTSNGSISWNVLFFNRFINRLGRINLRLNKDFEFCYFLMKNYAEKCDWDSISQNEYFPFTIDLIREFESLWNWSSLSWNTSLPKTSEFIDEFHAKLEWRPISQQVSFSKTEIETYQDNLQWYDLSSNEKIDWTLDLLYFFETRFSSYTMARYNSKIWVKIFEPYVDKIFIYEVLSNTTKINQET